jgi:dienelactone hydrolase
MRIVSAAIALAAVTFANPSIALAQSEQVVEFPSRNQKIRAILIKPQDPIGGVVLLAGGHGVLNIDPSGNIGWGKGNHVIRTRADYAKAGYIVLVPDAAPDLKGSGEGVPRYRWGSAHASDLESAVKYLRTMTKTVHLIGTSRAALSVANAGANLSGANAPDALVISSGMIVHISDKQPSAERNVGNLGRIKQPVFILYHEKDGCSYTPASSAQRGKALMTGSKKVDVKIITDPGQGGGDPCEAKSPHGFFGQDAIAVKAVTDWLAGLPK